MTKSAVSSGRADFLPFRLFIRVMGCGKLRVRESVGLQRFLQMNSLALD